MHHLLISACSDELDDVVSSELVGRPCTAGMKHNGSSLVFRFDIRPNEKKYVSSSTSKNCYARGSLLFVCLLVGWLVLSVCLFVFCFLFLLLLLLLFVVFFFFNLLFYRQKNSNAQSLHQENRKKYTQNPCHR